MRKLHPALTAGLSMLVGIAALASAAEARGGGFGGGGPGGGGGFGGAGHGGFGDHGAWGPGGSGYGPPGGGYNRPGGNGYGPVPGRRNPWAAGATPFIGIDYNDLLQTPPNNSGSSLPNDCNYLYKRAVDSGDPNVWRLFNDCAHNR